MSVQKAWICAEVRKKTKKVILLLTAAEPEKRAQQKLMYCSSKLFRNFVLL